MASDKELMALLRDRPRLEGAITRMRIGLAALNDEMVAIESYANGPWFDGVKAECDRRRAIALERFGSYVRDDVLMVVDAAGTADERHAPEEAPDER